MNLVIVKLFKINCDYIYNLKGFNKKELELLANRFHKLGFSYDRYIILNLDTKSDVYMYQSHYGNIDLTNNKLKLPQFRSKMVNKNEFFKIKVNIIHSTNYEKEYLKTNAIVKCNIELKYV